MNQVEIFYKRLEVAIEHQTRCSKAWLIGDDIIFVECKANAEIEVFQSSKD